MIESSQLGPTDTEVHIAIRYHRNAEARADQRENFIVIQAAEGELRADPTLCKITPCFRKNFTFSTHHHPPASQLRRLDHRGPSQPMAVGQGQAVSLFTKGF